MKSPPHGLPSILQELVPLLAALAGVVLAPPAQAARAPSELALQTPAWWRAYDDPWLHDLVEADEGPLADALRPLYIDYLLEHEGGDGDEEPGDAG